MVDDILSIQKCGNKSVQMNATVNSFIELKKLTFSQRKCASIHVGKNNKCDSCPVLKVHEEQMKESHQEKYLGDLINSSGKPKATISERVAKGYGIIAEIKSILNQLPVGNFRIEIGLLLRQAWLVNGCLYNSEVWHSLTKKDIYELEKVDQCLLRSLVNAHAKTPLEHLYLEMSVLPITYIITIRRMIYLQTILTRSENELIYRIYNAQKEHPVKGDWWNQVCADFVMLDIELNELEIKNMEIHKYKKHIKIKAREAAFRYLETLKMSHNKVKQNQYTNLNSPQSYLTSKDFTNDQVSLLFHLRSCTVREIKCNFPSNYRLSDECPLCESASDTQEHVLVCPVLYTNSDKINMLRSTVKYVHIQGSIREQLDLTTLYTYLLDLRTQILSDEAPAYQGDILGPAGTSS